MTTMTAFGNIDVSENIRTALVGDMDTLEIFYEYNAEESVEIASVTKIMTYLVAREAIEAGRVNFDDLVTVSTYAASIQGSSFNLRTGEEIPLRVLMNSIMIVSGNDAAVAIAEHVSGSEEAFLAEMHQKAEELGLVTAHFINPSGMPSDTQESDQNKMSAKDLFYLSAYLLKRYPDIAEVTIQREVTLPERNFTREATNPLLDKMPGVDGLKTGYTHKAGLCLVSTVPYRDDQDSLKDRRVIAVLMGAHSHEDRINKSKTLLEYGLYNYFIEKVISENESLGTIKVGNALEVDVPVVASEDYYKLVRTGTTFRTEMKFDEDIKAPMDKGTVIGNLNIYLNNEKVHTIAVVTEVKIERAGFFTRIFRFLANLLGI